MAEDRMLNDEILLGLIKANGGGGGGTTNYEDLNNLPKVNNVELKGNKSLADLGIASASTVSGILDGASIDSFADVETALNGKQDTLTFDDTPTDGSNNPVKSNGIYDSEKDIYATMGEMGAKNLISYPYHQNTKTEYGVTFTNNGDGSVTVSTVNTGATAEATFICHNRLNTEANELRIKNGKYILSGCPQGGSATTYLLTTNRTYNGSSEAMGNEYGSGKVITLNGDDYGADGVNLGISIVVKSGTIITTPITFKPMLRLASDTDGTYQPYAKTNKQLTDDVALLNSEKADTDMVAADFNAGTSYTAGNYCVQDGKLYKFKNNHTGAWSSADVDEVKITGELSALKSGLTNLIKRERFEKTTDSVGDFNFTLPSNSVLVSIRPLRITDHYSSWWGAIIASTIDNTGYSCKAIKDDGTALTSQSVLLDVYYI